MPSWEVVGLPDISVKESKERVRTAIKNSGYEFQSRRIVVNLAPANTKKEGSFFDLPIAIGILFNFEEITEQNLEDTIFIGELSLDGRLNRVNGILPMCIEARKLKMKRIILPEENAKEASIVEGIEVIGAKTLKQVVNYLNKKEQIRPQKANLEEFFHDKKQYLFDFSEVKGQENIKRALEVAAARRAQLLTYSERQVLGKTMMARRIPSILPDLTFEEALEVTKIHSIAGILSKDIPLLTTRPYRAPHHTVSASSLVGGGKIPKPRRN